MDKGEQKKKAGLGEKMVIAVCVLLAMTVIFLIIKPCIDSFTKYNNGEIQQGTSEAEKEEDTGKKDKNDNNENSQNSGDLEDGEKGEQDEAVENADSESINQSSSKPVITPATLPEGELLAAYNRTLIIGDSRVEGFKMFSGVKNAAYFCTKGITIEKITAGQTANISGSQVSVYDLLESAEYDKVIVAVGMNELGWTYIESFLTEYGKLIDSIREKQPQAQLYLHAVLPVTEEKDRTDNIYNNRQIYWYNENIMKLATSKNAIFVNPAGAVADENGFLVEGSTTDGVHLTSEYCKLWANYLAEMI